MASALAVAGLAAGVIEVGGWAGALLLLVPALVLLYFVVRAHRSAARPHEPPPTAARQVMTVLSPPAASNAEEAAAQPAGTAFAREEPQAPPAAPRVDDAAGTTSSTSSALPAASDPSWPERVAKAEAAGVAAEISAIYLAWARAEIACGEIAAAGDHLRTAVGVAARGRQPALHAEARLELAELARAAGDLTTACEHWQLARALYHDLKLREKVGDTERLMQRHGCPTDWVLNDF